MTIFYSNTSRGFYESSIHGTNIPEDSVEISSEVHRAMLEGQSQGKVISIDDDLQPILVDAPLPTSSEIKDSENKDILNQILQIEKELQPRALRDALLHNDNVRLLTLDDQIKALRLRLK